MLYHKSRSACGEIIHVLQILAELWSLTLRIFTHFSLSSQLLLHPCMDLNESWQGCCTTSLEEHVGNNSIMFDKFWQSYGPWHLEFLHIWDTEILHDKSKSACGEIIHFRQILAELWSLTLRIFIHFSLSSQLLLHPCMDLNNTRQGCCTTSLEVHVGW